MRPTLVLAISGTWCLPLAAQGDWTLQQPTTSPTVVSDHALVYDLLRARTWLIGGATTGGGLSNETWSYDGSTWTRLAPPNSPTPRMRHAAAFDLPRGKIVLFGGSTATNSGHLGDTWEFDGTNWTQLTPVTQPPVRRDFTMVYDRLRQRVVMFGGFQGHALGLPLNDTWEWDGTDWTRIQAPAAPAPRGGHVAAYDLARQRVTLFAGYPLSNDTWNYDGTNWQQQAVTRAPTSRSGHAMVYDLVRRRLVLAAGYDTAFTNDTWEFSSPNLGAINALGTGCPGSAGTPVLATSNSSLPWTGQPLTFEVRSVPATAPLALLLGASNVAWGALPLPIDLGVIGMSGCILRTSVDVIAPMTNANGVGTLPVLVPGSAALIGQRFYAQTFVVDTGASGGATLANALEVLLGAL